MPPSRAASIWITICIAIVAASGLVTACGSQSTGSDAHSLSTQKAPAHGATTPGDGGRSLTKVRALALARQINLRAGDIPGFRAEHEGEAAAKRFERGMLRCTQGVDFSEGLGEATSDDYAREASIYPESVTSSVTVVRTPEFAAKAVATIGQNRARICLTRDFDAFFSSHSSRSATIGPVAISHGSPPRRPRWEASDGVLQLR